MKGKLLIGVLIKSLIKANKKTCKDAEILKLRYMNNAFVCWENDKKLGLLKKLRKNVAWGSIENPKNSSLLKSIAIDVESIKENQVVHLKLNSPYKGKKGIKPGYLFEDSFLLLINKYFLRKKTKAVLKADVV